MGLSHGGRLHEDEVKTEGSRRGGGSPLKNEVRLRGTFVSDVSFSERSGLGEEEMELRLCPLGRRLQN